MILGFPENEATGDVGNILFQWREWDHLAPRAYGQPGMVAWRHTVASEAVAKVPDVSHGKVEVLVAVAVALDHFLKVSFLI